MRWFALVFVALSGVALAQAQKLSVRVEGEGYLRFALEGKLVYAKSAELVVVNGRLGLATGARLMPDVVVPSAEGLTIDLEGKVVRSGVDVGRIVLALFKSPQTESGPVFSASERPSLANPGEGTAGVVRSGPTPKATTVTPGFKPVPSPSKASLATDIAATTKTVVTLSDRCEVAGDSITLGEIADIKAPTHVATRLAEIVLGDTPMLPVERIVDRNRIGAKIKLAGLDPDTVSLVGPDKVKVTRKGQKVTHSQFVESAVQGAKIKGYGGTLEPTTPGPDLTAPLGELQLVCESVSGSNVDLSATIGVYVDGRRFNSRTVKLRSTVSAQALKVGAIVTVRVRSRSVYVDSNAKVTKFDPLTGQTTVQVTDTGVSLIGKLTPDGIVEVKA